MDDAIYIITVRHPLDTAVSWQKFIMPSNVKAHNLVCSDEFARWQHMMMQILQHTEDATTPTFFGI